MEYIAHSMNLECKTQTMKQHMDGVAKIMCSFALSPEFYDIYSYCGQMHDFGKYSDAFQKYIRGNGDKAPHAKWGALHAKNNRLINIAIAIYGHHAGLANRDEMFETLNLQNLTYLDAIKQNSINDHFQIPLCSNDSFNRIETVTEKELFVRLLFSALVDADSLDTERHFREKEYESRPCKQLSVDELLSALNVKLQSFKQNSELNKLRTEVRLYAQMLAPMPQGCFSMTLPTGMGKTLCSINWALHHAKAHTNIKRIIVVLPFISIIDQTASELKQVFKEQDIVLEHHSNIILEGNDKAEDILKDSKLLATENWDYPIIVTTAVQFFESLFSNKRSKCRKIHNIQDSVVIFDEIQTLPMNLAECTMRMLNDMVHLCRCSFLFCTATQPDFQTRRDFKGIDKITPLVKDASSVFNATKRVDYIPIENYEALSVDEVAEKVIKQNTSVLIVCNTKKKALALYESLKSKTSISVLHLSTNMCQHHRLTTINRVRQMLQNGEHLILCSTQLIEAGVDLDFPVVFRELAPLESIIQSAGRCNREGRQKLGRVYLFQLSDSGQPSLQYETFASYAQMCYQGNEHRFHDADFYEEYYRNIMNLYKPEDCITPEREKLMFQNVADKYKIINSSTTTLFIYNYSEESRQLYGELKEKEYLNRSDYNRIAQYSVQVYDRFMNQNYDKIGDMNDVKIWFGAYKKETGLTNEDEIYIV